VVTVTSHVAHASDKELIARAQKAAGAVVDPELPMLTLADLGVLRSVELLDGRLVVTITPTYTGCPAMATMRADLRLALAAAGFPEAEVRTTLAPAWTTDWITEQGRRALHEHGIAPPGPAGPRPVALQLLERPSDPTCPRCGSTDTRVVSRFGASPCTSQHTCRSCAEPFDKVKEL
jgi:ring-1,2-phenylacetyl-CoA epoxidase subunit PaaD